MKRLNRKGFTLIELMVVIAILVIIMGIALPNITSSIERSKQKQKEAKIDLITSSAELYFDRHSTASKENGVLVSTIITDQNVPGISEDDVCNNRWCCVKYNASHNKYELYDTRPEEECDEAS